MMKRVFVLLVTVILVALFAACSDDEDDKSSGPVLAPEQVLTVTQVEIPSALSKASDPKVKEAVDWIRTANALAETMAPMLRPQADGAGARPAGPRLASAVGDTVVWNWHPYAELQATLTWWESDTAYHWILSWDGTAQIGGEHLVFNDFKLVEATESRDGTLGFWFVYGIEYSPDPIFQWEWHIDASGNFSLTAGAPDEGWYIVLEVNSDDTGTISYYEDNQLELRAAWDADGSGQWWEYENGSLIDSGSWV